MNLQSTLLDIASSNNFIQTSPPDNFPLVFSFELPNTLTSLTIDIAPNSYLCSANIIDKPSGNALIISPTDISIDPEAINTFIQTWKFFSGLYNDFRALPKNC